MKYCNTWSVSWPYFTVTTLNLSTDKSKAGIDFCERRGQVYALWSFLLSKHWIKVLMVALWICWCFAVHYADSLMQLLTGTLQLQKKWQILSLPNACCLLTNACNHKAVEGFERQSYRANAITRMFVQHFKQVTFLGHNKNNSLVFYLWGRNE